MKPQHQRFVDGILAGLPAVKAYQDAGFRPKTYESAKCAASRLLSSVNVQEAIRRRREPIEVAVAITHQLILEGLLAEATRQGDDASHAARVQAWRTLAQTQGMLSIKLKVDGTPLVRVVGGVDVGLLTGTRKALPEGDGDGRG